jgi:hypothetical protein
MRIAPVVLAAALLPALPASAQGLGSPTVSAPRPRADNWGGSVTQPRGGYRTKRVHEGHADHGYGRELARIRREIRRAQDKGQITRREERALLRQSGRIGRSGYRASAGGISLSEGGAIRGQIEALRGQVTAARTRGISR